METAIIYEGNTKSYTTPMIISNPKEGKKIQVTGLWDTGANITTIKTSIAVALGMKYVNVGSSNTAGGKVKSYLFYADVLLLNGIKIRNIMVSSVDNMSVDALIGTDIINLGDFAIVHVAGKAEVKFRIPYDSDIDFQKAQKEKELKIKTIMENQSDGLPVKLSKLKGSFI